MTPREFRNRLHYVAYAAWLIPLMSVALDGCRCWACRNRQGR